MAQYNEYKESGQQWLGKVPSHWGLLPGKALFLENKRKNVDNSIREVLSLSYGKIIRKKNIDEGLVPENYCGYQIVEPNDIIIRCTDLQNDKVSLRTGFVENFGIISGAYLGLKCISPNLPKYLHYYLHTWDITKELYRYGAGLRQSLSWNDVKYLSILIPPADEQAGIVAYLDKVTADIDKAIVAKERIISALEERRKIIITEAVTRGINPDAPLRDSGIDWLGQIPAHWEIVPLKTICRFGQSLNITKADLVEEGFPVINYGQVHSKFNSKTALSDELIRYVPKFHADNSPNCLCGKNDFIGLTCKFLCLAED